jgi:hypothetical protein
VSDCQVVRSHVVIPDLIDEVYVARPRLAPCIVTLDDPVEAPFLLRAILTTSPAIEKPSVALPTSIAAVSSVFRLLKTPCPDWQRIDVSDPHVVRSHDVCDNRRAAVYVARPRFRPTTVMLADPVAARFDRSTALIARLSADSTADELPARIPTVTNRRRLPPTPCDTPHRNDVSDSHVVRSHAEAPSLEADVNAPEPKPPPCTVTLADPVVAMFVRRTKLLPPESNDRPWVLLPTFCEVTDIWRLPITPSPVWHRVDVSDSHVVRSHAVSPNRDPAVYVVRPMLAP